MHESISGSNDLRQVSRNAKFNVLASIVKEVRFDLNDFRFLSFVRGNRSIRVQVMQVGIDGAASRT